MPFSYGAYDMIASFHGLKRFSPEAEDARGTRTRLDLGQGYVDCRKGAGVKLKSRRGSDAAAAVACGGQLHKQKRPPLLAAVLSERSACFAKRSS